jgi:pimeloyl-ACP methyl ester carboxylesterase
MSSVTTIDGTRIFYKDWGSKTLQPTVFSHGWPLCSDEARKALETDIATSYAPAGMAKRTAIEWKPGSIPSHFIGAYRSAMTRRSGAQTGNPSPRC